MPGYNLTQLTFQSILQRVLLGKKGSLTMNESHKLGKITLFKTH